MDLFPELQWCKATKHSLSSLSRSYCLDKGQGVLRKQEGHGDGGHTVSASGFWICIPSLPRARRRIPHVMGTETYGSAGAWQPFCILASLKFSSCLKLIQPWAAWGTAQTRPHPIPRMAQCRHRGPTTHHRQYILVLQDAPTLYSSPPPDSQSLHRTAPRCWGGGVLRTLARAPTSWALSHSQSGAGHKPIRALPLCPST